MGYRTSLTWKGDRPGVHRSRSATGCIYVLGKGADSVELYSLDTRWAKPIATCPRLVKGRIYDSWGNSDSTRRPCSAVLPLACLPRSSRGSIDRDRFCHFFAPFSRAFGTHPRRPEFTRQRSIPLQPACSGLPQAAGGGRDCSASTQQMTQPHDRRGTPDEARALPQPRLVQVNKVFFVIPSSNGSNGRMSS